MSFNPGTISLLLYLTLLLLSIAGLFFIYRLLLKNKLENDKMDKLIDLFKTVVITSAVSTAGLIIANLFKQREYDKNEMQAFNEYIPYVVEVGPIEKKLALCDFFVAVTSDSKFFLAWKNWEKVLKAANDKTLKNVDKVRAIDINGGATNTELGIAERLEGENVKTLASVHASEPTSYLIILSAYKTIKEAEEQIGRVKEFNKDAAIYKKRDWYRIVIPANTSWQNAKVIAQAVNNKVGKKEAYVVSLKTWCNSVSATPKKDCFVCKIDS